MAPPNVKAVIAVPAAPGMKNEQKRVRGMVRDRPIVATGYQLDALIRSGPNSLPAGVVLSIAIDQLLAVPRKIKLTNHVDVITGDTNRHVDDTMYPDRL